MNFDFSDEQKVLRDQARKFLGERASPQRVRRVIAAFAMDLLDMGGMVSDPELAPMRAAFQDALLYTPGGRIAAGTDEILKNIIAERVLGLPADIRVDKDLPFSELPTGKR
jgi:alkylation response protein AidB-like acyl-CoA dehydrogenase